MFFTRDGMSYEKERRLQQWFEKQISVYVLLQELPAPEISVYVQLSAMATQPEPQPRLSELNSR